MEEEIYEEEFFEDGEINEDELMDENLFDKIMENVPIVEDEEKSQSPRLEVSHEEDLEELIDNYEIEEDVGGEIENQAPQTIEEKPLNFDEEDFKDV
jgi:hypothetical protein